MPSTSPTKGNNAITHNERQIQTAPTEKSNVVAIELSYISTSGIVRPESQTPRKRPRVEQILLK